MDPPVVVVTRLDDPTADLVIAELHERAVPVVRIDPADCPSDIELAAFLDQAGLTGSLVTSTRDLALENVRSVYWRRPSPYQAAPGLDHQSAKWAVEQTRWGLGGVLATLPRALYVNHPWPINEKIATALADLLEEGLA